MAADDRDIGVFEVFRVGSVKRSELAQQDDLTALRKKYSLLCAVDSLEQVRGAGVDFELAVAAPPAHMIVDKNSFASLMRQRIGEAIAEKEKELRLMADDKVVMAAERIHKDRVVMAGMFKAVFLASWAQLEGDVGQITAPSDDDSQAAWRAGLASALDKHKAKMLALLNSEHFLERPAEQDAEHDQPAASSSP